MNYYDEEINLNQIDPNQIGNAKVEKLPGKNNESDRLSSSESFPRSESKRQERKQSLLYGVNSVNVKDIVRTNPDDNDMSNNKLHDTSHRIIKSLSPEKMTENESENSNSDSDELNMDHKNANVEARATDIQSNITMELLESLPIPLDVKNILPFILKYTPQHIDSAYHLQPFVPDYVPAVGDIDAFLKVTIPILPQPQPNRQIELNDHLSKMGLHYLDEPSGEQSEPSLLNMKLRSVLTGNSVNPRSISASLIPTKVPKDIDKWIVEVEKVHMAQSSSFQIQTRKDIDALVLDWPRSFADTTLPISSAYQRFLQKEISLLEYIKVLSEIFEIHGSCEVQGDYILNIETLFAMYLVAYQAWE